MSNAITAGSDNYKAVDIMKYIASVMVICIHCNPIVSNVYMDYFIRQIVCRTAVPFFFISSAYFFRMGCAGKKGYLKSYLKKLSGSYLVWSILFIPIGLDWIHQNLMLSKELLPAALLLGLVHIGTYYHLWYIPALIISLFIGDKLLKRFSYKKVIPISLLLFLFGSLETYYGVLPDGWLKRCFDIVIQILFTTRSGLFYGMIFVVTGFFIYDYQEKLKVLCKHITILTIISGLLLIAEGSLLYSVIKLDMNFLISLIPFSFFFFLQILVLPKTVAGNTKRVRELSRYYYFLHVIPVVIIEETGKALQLPALWSGLVSFLLVVMMTHILCMAVISIAKQPFKGSVMIVSALTGMALTFITASLVYRNKPEDIIIKFEYVPCLWICFSMFSCFLLCRLRKYLKENRLVHI